MNNNKLIAEALLEIARERSTTTFIDVSEDKELIEAAQKIGIVLPSPDLAVMKTVYAEIDKVNKNGVVLPRKAVEIGLPTLIGKQVNWEHSGAGRICGYTIDASINEDKIETINVIFKSLFPEEFDTVKERFENKELAVSFEIWNINPETKDSVIHRLDNGFVSIDKIIFHGTGLLLSQKPACPKAKVYKLLAKAIEDTENITDKLFGENLIFAELAIEESKCKNCGTCNCEEEEKKLEELINEPKIEEIEKVEEVSAEEAKDRLCPECKQLMKDEDTELCAECKKKKDTNESSEETKIDESTIETKTEETSEVAETKVEETKVEETKEEVVVEEVKEEASVVTTTQEITKVDEINLEGETITTEVKIETTVVDDEGKEIQKMVEEIKTVVTYTFEQVQEAVNTSTEELVAAMPKEVSDRIKELIKEGKSVKEAMKQAWEEYKEKTTKATEDIISEKDKVITKMKQELESKSQEISKLTAKDETTEKKTLDLEVGNVNIEAKDEIKKQAEKINDIIANKGKK